MKKYTRLLLLILFISCSSHAQMSYILNRNNLNRNNLFVTTESDFALGNKDYLTNATTIIDGIRIDDQMKSTIKERELDGLYLIRLTHVLRSNELKAGDTIIVIFRNAASGTESMYNSNTRGYPHIFYENPVDRSPSCEWFLKEYTGKIDLNKLNWGNRKVYEFYRNEYGFATVYFKEKSFTEAAYDVYALFNLKFKTKQDWYNYLKKYDNIKVPDGY